jgi:ABC-2 type transport system ATP-binding protein
VIDARGLRKRFGATEALSDVSVSVGAGEVLCLLGANGAGKTTLVDICLGFVRPDAGTVSIDGHDVLRDSFAARQRTGYVPEQVLLYDTMTGLEHVRFFAEVTGRAVPDETALDALALAGLGRDAAERRLGTYSKGMRQKVALAIALSKQARVLLLDEPLSGLDPKSAIDLSERLRELSRRGLAVLVTTHDLLRARETATHIGIMRAGRLVHLVETAGIALPDLERLYLDTMG